MRKNKLNKKLQHSLLLLILPVILFLASDKLKSDHGPYYLNTRYDPVYVYLINSLNLAQLHAPAHVDHPGTPLQIIGAVVIKTYHLINNNSTDISEDVLKNPESYLNAIFLVLIFINAAVLFLTGYSVFRTTGNIFIGLLFQLSPFISFTVLYEFSGLSAENLLIPAIMIFIAVSIRFIYSGYPVSKNNYYFVILFSLICGFGIATKIIFFPLTIIPLVLLQGVRKKLIFLAFTVLFFLVFVSPALSNYNYFLDWVKRLFLYDGIYGTGNPDIIDSSAFMIHLKEIFINETLFMSVYLLILIFIVSSFFSFRRMKSGNIMQEYKLLLAVFITMTLQILIISKHYSDHYMVSSLVLTVPAIFLTVNIFYKKYYPGLKSGSLNYIYILLSVVIFSFSVYLIIDNFNLSMKERDEAILLNRFINENYPSAKIIASYGSSSEEYALAFSTKWAGSQKGKYQSILSRLYPDRFYFEFWENKIYSFNEAGKDSILHPGDVVLFQNKFPDSNEKVIESLKNSFGFHNPDLKELLSNENGETVYMVMQK